LMHLFCLSMLVIVCHGRDPPEGDLSIIGDLHEKHGVCGSCGLAALTVADRAAKNSVESVHCFLESSNFRSWVTVVWARPAWCPVVQTLASQSIFALAAICIQAHSLARKYPLNHDKLPWCMKFIAGCGLETVALALTMLWRSCFDGMQNILLITEDRREQTFSAVGLIVLTLKDVAMLFPSIAILTGSESATFMLIVPVVGSSVSLLSNGPLQLANLLYLICKVQPARGPSPVTLEDEEARWRSNAERTVKQPEEEAEQV